jgi:hypothetical protein
MDNDNWIKALGGGAREAQLPDDWGTVADGLFHNAVTFGRRPNIERGDQIALYASGWKLIFAVGEVTTYPYQAESSSETPWPWRVNVQLSRSVRYVHDGVPLDALSVDGRDLSVSMRRRSHMRLSDAEYQIAVAGLARQSG